MTKVSVVVNKSIITFSSGKHNQLQKLIIEEFATRFAPNSECLHVGDTNKDLVKNEEILKLLGLEITLHNKILEWFFIVKSVISYTS